MVRPKSMGRCAASSPDCDHARITLSTPPRTIPSSSLGPDCSASVATTSGHEPVMWVSPPRQRLETDCRERFEIDDPLVRHHDLAARRRDATQGQCRDDRPG